MHELSTPNPLEFLGCQIAWSPVTLIPRLETEFLPDHAAPFIEDGKVCWDICCGTGCLGLAMKKRHPKLDVTLSDISLPAVALSIYNAKVNELDVKVVCGDLFAPFEGKADYIFFNPPYVREDEYAHLEPSVKDFEPKLALVSGPSGLEMYERFKTEMDPYLNEGAKLFFEIGTGQGSAIQKIFGGGKVLLDLAGHERYFILET